MATDNERLGRLQKEGFWFLLVFVLVFVVLWFWRPPFFHSLLVPFVEWFAFLPFFGAVLGAIRWAFNELGLFWLLVLAVLLGVLVFEKPLFGLEEKEVSKAEKKGK